MKYATSRCYIFPDGSVWLMDHLLCLCNVWKGRSYVNSNVSVSSIFDNGQFYLKYYFLYHRNPPFKEIQLSVNCYVSVLILTSMLNLLQFFIFIALGRTSQSLPKNVSYWRQQTDVTETSFLSIVFKCFSISLLFQYWL